MTGLTMAIDVKPRPAEGQYTFDPKRAAKVVKFIQLLKHTKGEYAGKPFQLAGWERHLVEDVFGWIDRDGYRRYSTAFVEVPCKNGKSTLAAAIALYLLVADGEQGAEIYSAALNRDQAKIVFNEARSMVMLDDYLKKHVTIYENEANKRLHYHKTNSFYRVLTGSAKGNEGLNAHGFFFDELHVQPDRALYDVARKRMGSRRQPLMMITTTAGFDRRSIAWEVHDYADKLRRGVIEDPTFYSCIYDLPEDADPWDEKNWHKANPALVDGYKNIKRMREDAQIARENLAEQNSFRRYHLNQWTRADVRAIDYEKWAACGGAINYDKLKDVPCYVAIDLASRFDIAAVCVCWRVGEDYHFWWRYYVPEKLPPRLKARADLYETWKEQGHVMATPGDVIDQNYILEDVTEFCESLNVAEVLYDPWNATKLITDFEERGIEPVEFNQGARNISSPTKEFITAVIAGKIHHGDNPVTTWMADNLVLSSDSRGNVRPDREKSAEKIDGMVAAIMAFGKAMASAEEGGFEAAKPGHWWERYSDARP